MTVKELRTLIDNLDEYIHVPGGIERLKKTVLHLAVSGQLVPQDPSEGTGEELHRQIQSEKEKLIKDGKLKKQKPLAKLSPEEIPFSVPTAWRWTRLGDISESINTGPFGSMLHKHDYVHGGIPIINPMHIVDGRIVPSQAMTLSVSRQTDFSRYILKLNDIVIARRGEVGRAARIRKDDGLLMCGTGSFFVRAHHINQDYLVAYLQSNYARDYLKKQSIGTTMVNLNQTMLQNLPIPLPDNTMQLAILRKLEVINTLIDELAGKYKAELAGRNKLVSVALAGLARGDSRLVFTHLTEIIRTKADASELRKTILHLAVSGQLVPQDSAEGTGEELYQQIQAEKAKLVKNGRIGKQKPTHPIAESEIPFDIPQNWKWVRVRDTGYALGQKKPDKDFYYIDVSSIDNKRAEMTNDLPLTSPANAPSRARKLVSDGTVIYSTVRPYLLNTAIIENAEGKELIASTAFAIVHPYAGISSKWILYNFLAPYFVEYVNSKSVGAAYPAINDAAFDKSIIPLPPLTEQTRIVQKTTQLLDLVTQLEQRLEK